MSKKILLLLRWLVGLAILSYLLYIIGIKDILLAFTKLNYFFLPLIALIFALNFAIGTFNIKILTNPLKCIDFFTLLKYYALSWSVGLFVPGKLGEFSIVYLLKKKGIGFGKGCALSIIDKVITLLTLFLVALFGVLLFFDFYVFLRVLMAFVLSFVILYFIIVSNLGRGLVKRYVLRSYAVHFKGFHKTIKDYFKNRKRTLILNFFLTLSKWFCVALIIYFLLLAFGISSSYPYVLLVSCVVTLFTLIPISISGLGIRESIAVYLFHLSGIGSPVVMGVYLIILVINYCIATLSITLLSKEFVKRESRKTSL